MATLLLRVHVKASVVFVFHGSLYGRHGNASNNCSCQMLVKLKWARIRVKPRKCSSVSIS